MIRSMSLRTQLIVSSIGAVLIPFIIAGIIIYSQLRISLISIAFERSANVAEDTAALLDAILQKEIMLIEAFAADPDIVLAARSDDYVEARSELKAIHDRIGSNLFTFFITDRYGIARADVQFEEQIGLDLSGREYFSRARDGKTTIAGPIMPLGTATPGQPIVIASAPITENGEFLGMIAAPFDIIYLSNIILGKHSGDTGHAFVIDNSGLLLIHPEYKDILRLRYFDQPGTDNLEDFVTTGANGIVSYRLYGSEIISGVAHMTTTNWTVVFAQSRDETLLPMRNALGAILIGAIAYLILTSSIIIFISDKISSPIQRLLSTMKQVTLHASELIIQIGPDRKITYANPSYERATGYSLAELIGTEPKLTNTTGVSATNIWRQLENGQAWTGRLSVQTARGTLQTLQIMLVPLREHHEIAGYLGIGQDITSELLLEQRLRQAQKLEAVGTLAGGIAHDFNNILSGIFGYAELYQTRSIDDEEADHYVDEIVKASERARDLVKQILTFSRQTESKPEPLRPGAVLKEVLKLIRATIPSIIQIKARLESDAMIMAETTQIHQLALNLCTNAAQAIGDVEGLITIDLSDFDVTESYADTYPELNPGRYVLLKISDSGCGIEADAIDRIFEPFFTTKKESDGTGLGLAVVHGIVRKLNGMVSVYSVPGEGTTFAIFIPAIEPVETETKTHIAVRTGTERIALIDDEEQIVNALGSLLSNLGYTVKRYTDGMEALSAISRDPGKYDIIITDYAMPHITGFEIANTLREQGISIPIILMSGYLGPKLEAAISKAQIEEVIMKPVETYQLTSAIARVFDDGDVNEGS